MCNSPFKDYFLVTVYFIFFISVLFVDRQCQETAAPCSRGPSSSSLRLWLFWAEFLAGRCHCLSPLCSTFTEWVSQDIEKETNEDIFSRFTLLLLTQSHVSYPMRAIKFYWDRNMTYCSIQIAGGAVFVKDEMCVNTILNLVLWYCRDTQARASYSTNIFP